MPSSETETSAATPQPSSSATPDGGRILKRITPADLTTQLVPIADLVHHPKNARKGNLETIKDSIREHGQYRTIVVQRSTGYVIAGNHTLQAMRELDYEHAAVGYVDVDNDQAERILTVDNRANDEAGYDDQALLSLLEGIKERDAGLAGTGYDEDSLMELRRITGQLGRDQSSFLDDLRQPAAGTDGHGDGQHHFVLNFPVTRAQRDKINQALQKVQRDRELETTVEALEALADDVLRQADDGNGGRRPRTRAQRSGDKPDA